MHTIIKSFTHHIKHTQRLEAYITKLNKKILICQIIIFVLFIALLIACI
jgi:hypothetical protein